jgi:DNA-binding PadR family transcriptional regulator
VEHSEIEELNPLQTFLLVLVEFGLTTPYDLLSKAGLGPGLTSPSLKRLERAGLLASTPGPRNRLRYAITAKGAYVLRQSLKPDVANYWQAGQADIFESLPRGIILAWLHAGVDEARRGTTRAADNLLLAAQRRRREAEELHGFMLRLRADLLKDASAVDRGFLIATAYRWIKAECDAALFQQEAEAIEHINQLLADLPPAPQVQSD